MLVINRKVGERIKIGDDIYLMIVRIKGGTVRVGVEAPKDVPVRRVEIGPRAELIDIQRLRNLTTGRLHTEMGHIYKDLEKITGETGLMTHMLPRVIRAVEPWLRKHVTEKRFWDGKFDQSHVGQIELPESTESERLAMLERFRAQPNPLASKDVVVVDVDDEGRLDVRV